MPSIRLSWSTDATKDVEEAISFEHASKRAKKPAPTTLATGDKAPPKTSTSVTNARPRAAE
jgi:hypothetical protein